MPFSASQAIKHPIVMLSGEEPILRSRALAALLEALGPGDDDFDREEFDADASSPTDWLGSAGTAPFLGERRVVTVRHLLRGDPTDVKLQGLPASALLVLVADEETGDDGRQQRLKSVRGAWEKLAASSGGFVERFEAESKEVKKAVRAEAQALGKKMSDTAAETLVEMTGGSISRALEELNKLAIFVGDQPEIREADVRSVAVPSREWNVFNLVDSLLSGQSATALRQLKILVGSQNKAEEAAMRSILPQMSRNLRLVWQARVLLDAKVHVNALPPEIAALMPERNDIRKEKTWVQEKIVRLARRVSLPQVSRCLQIIAETDARLKGMLDGFSGMDTLERMALEIAQAVR